MNKLKKVKSPMEGIDWYVCDIIPTTKIFALDGSKTNDSLKQILGLDI